MELTPKDWANVCVAIYILFLLLAFRWYIKKVVDAEHAEFERQRKWYTEIGRQRIKREAEEKGHTVIFPKGD